MLRYELHRQPHYSRRLCGDIQCLPHSPGRKYEDLALPRSRYHVQSSIPWSESGYKIALFDKDLEIECGKSMAVNKPRVRAVAFLARTRRMY